MPVDARWYQISCLSILLALGVARLEFDLGLTQILLSIGGVLLTQWACTRWWQAGAFEPKSALISGLSLCLLLRSDQLWVVLFAAFVSIATKFVVRVRGKHIFNPTNIGVVAAIELTGRAWVSPGQWGNVVFYAFLFACLGGLVVNRAARADITWSFLLFWAGGVVGRSLWLGEPLRIPIHRLESGSLLLFAFFMISDPRATPDARIGRILYAACVAGLAWYFVFKMFIPTGLLYSLAICSPLVPVFDWLFPAHRYTWTPQSEPVRSAA